MRSALARALAVIAVPALLVAGCASADPKASDSTKTSATTELSGVKVTGDLGKKPTVTLAAKPTSVKKSGTVVVKPGTGAAITKGQRVTLDYVLLNGKDGKEADTSFGKAPANFPADPAKFMPGLANGMIGQKVGSRVLVGITPADGFGAEGNEQLGFAKDDALLFVLDLKGAKTPLAKATGAAVAPVAGDPEVTYDAKGVPTITPPKTAPPKKTVSHLLIKGTGLVVKAGQSVSAAYQGSVYGTGKVFDSSYQTGKLLDQQVGVGGLVKGFDASVVGQPVGSRILMVIPPAEGFGKAGSPTVGIKGTDTIVFVVDILDAY